SDRYLSFAEREEIALLHVQGKGIREIARSIGRDPGAASRELRRNAAHRTDPVSTRDHGKEMSAHALKTRLRKTLGWKTPAEAFNEQLLLLPQAGVATTG